MINFATPSSPSGVKSMATYFTHHGMAVDEIDRLVARVAALEVENDRLNARVAELKNMLREVLNAYYGSGDWPSRVARMMGRARSLVISD